VHIPFPPKTKSIKFTRQCCKFAYTIYSYKKINKIFSLPTKEEYQKLLGGIGSSINILSLTLLD
jgi:hypothetical protein